MYFHRAHYGSRCVVGIILIGYTYTQMHRCCMRTARYCFPGTNTRALPCWEGQHKREFQRGYLQFFFFRRPCSFCYMFGRDCLEEGCSVGCSMFGPLSFQVCVRFIVLCVPKASSQSFFHCDCLIRATCVLSPRVTQYPPILVYLFLLLCASPSHRFPKAFSFLVPSCFW